MPDADAVALLSCVATCTSIFEGGGGSASAVAVGALLTCAALVAMAHIKVGTTHSIFKRFSFPGSLRVEKTALAPPVHGNARAMLTICIIDSCKGDDIFLRRFSCNNEASQMSDRSRPCVNHIPPKTAQKQGALLVGILFQD